MSKYDTRPVRYVARHKIDCQFCQSDILKGQRLCMLGMHRACRNCESLLPERYRADIESRIYPTRKFTEDQVRKIRELYNEGDLTQTALAEMYGCAQTTIGQLVRGEHYRNVT